MVNKIPLQLLNPGHFSLTDAVFLFSFYQKLGSEMPNNIPSSPKCGKWFKRKHLMFHAKETMHSLLTHVTNIISWIQYKVFCLVRRDTRSKPQISNSLICMVKHTDGHYTKPKGARPRNGDSTVQLYSFVISSVTHLDNSGVWVSINISNGLYNKDQGRMHCALLEGHLKHQWDIMATVQLQ